MNNQTVEKEFDKIALYSIDTEYAHIARQLKSGEWTSKIGDLEDISHKTLEILEGDLYGKVALIMKRKRNKK